jgi:hypothetical protein
MSGNVNRRFGDIYNLNIQDMKLKNEAVKKMTTASRR